MRKIFYKASPFVKAEALMALEAGADGLIVPRENCSEASALARVEVLIDDEVNFLSLAAKGAEAEAFSFAIAGNKVVLRGGWAVIPVENLLARLQGHPAFFGLEAANLDEALLASEILERGVPVIVLVREGLGEIHNIVVALKYGLQKLELVPAVITVMRPVGRGHRVCVDTTSLLNTGQGLLVGNSAGFFFLVNAETEPNEYVAERPFRVNAGAVHSYCLGPRDVTSYLGELRAGSRVLIVNAGGETVQATVGRAKVEQRPMLLIEAETLEPGEEKRVGTVFLQNAETIRLVSPEGQPVSVVNLQVGSRVLCRVDDAGRHFGMRIEEDILEG